MWLRVLLLLLLLLHSMPAPIGLHEGQNLLLLLLLLLLVVVAVVVLIVIEQRQPINGNNDVYDRKSRDSHLRPLTPIEMIEPIGRIPSKMKILAEDWNAPLRSLPETC